MSLIRTNKPGRKRKPDKLDRQKDSRSSEAPPTNRKNQIRAKDAENNFIFYLSKCRVSSYFGLYGVLVFQ